VVTALKDEFAADAAYLRTFVEQHLGTDAPETPALPAKLRPQLAAFLFRATEAKELEMGARYRLLVALEGLASEPVAETACSLLDSLLACPSLSSDGLACAELLLARIDETTTTGSPRVLATLLRALASPLAAERQQGQQGFVRLLALKRVTPTLFHNLTAEQQVVAWQYRGICSIAASPRHYHRTRCLPRCTSCCPTRSPLWRQQRSRRSRRCR